MTIVKDRLDEPEYDNWMFMMTCLDWHSASQKAIVLDNHLYSILSILPDSIFHIPSLTPLSSSSITFSFLIVIRLRHAINANATSVETPYNALSSPKIYTKPNTLSPNRFFIVSLTFII